MLITEGVLSTQENYLERNGLQLPKQPLQVRQQKLSLYWVIFFINLGMMISIPAVCAFELFWNPKLLDVKAYVGFGLSGYCVVTILLTLINLRIKLINFIKAIFIMDSILISLSILSVAFIGMMKYLDRNKWEMKSVQIAFISSVMASALNVRILLLYMNWKPSQVVIFKLGLYFVALTYFSVGVYCFYTNYSFTFNILPNFDKQCKYFVLLFVFAAFDFSCRLIKTMSSFDYTQKLKYVYIIKNVNMKQMQKHKQIKKSHKYIQYEKGSQKQSEKDERSINMIPVTKFRSQQYSIEYHF